MARDRESPYPANAVFAVHKGFRTGVCKDFKDFLAQTEGFPEGKLAWAVFANVQHATEYARTGICPVRPIDEKALGAAVPGSGRSLPTPDTSPETEHMPPPLPTRQLPIGAPLTASASQPPPAPRKPPTAQPEPDSDGDTEPEEEYKPASSSLPAPGTVRTPQGNLPRRPHKPGSILGALRRHASATEAKPTSPDKDAAPTTVVPIPPSTAPAASGSGSSRQTHRGPSTPSGSGSRTVPAPVVTSLPAPPAPIIAPALFAAPAPVPATLVPDLPRQPRPHGTYEQCHHCDGKGWILTPSHQTTTLPLAQTQPTVTHTPSRPRPIPTTNLRLVSASDSDSASSRVRTPSGSRLRLSSIGGGVGPERTPKRDAKRSVSDTAAGRRRIVSDGAKDKGKGKARALEPMDVDASDAEAGPSAYNYV